MFGFIKKKSNYFLNLDDASTNGAAKAEPAAKKPEAVKETAAKPIKSEPVKASVASTNGKMTTQAAPLTTFAPNYLMPTPTANRRLPGPNMDGFRDMARQMKKSN